ncbi:hypothetical protein [Paenibacillus oceani]|uniref:Uncharacterized protein n=1 Tax=Paenibacillus oceani TaxID=2772510 RepID=A0A927CCU5_9BACL|nr:hypothetical protein [Paenibacillus oceani]MBD2865708.1 hypothetical protein [Paenibacillus oceani]
MDRKPRPIRLRPDAVHRADDAQRGRLGIRSRVHDKAPSRSGQRRITRLVGGVHRYPSLLTASGSAFAFSFPYAAFMFIDTT